MGDLAGAGPLREAPQMRLSEAIMLGSTLSKQGFGPEAMHQEERCAIGAALQALNVQVTSGNTCFGYVSIHEKYPELRDLRPPCPAGKCLVRLDEEATAVAVIWHLNDIHEWTRERIAEWVSTIEPPDRELAEMTLTKGMTLDEKREFDRGLAITRCHGE